MSSLSHTSHSLRAEPVSGSRDLWLFSRTVDLCVFLGSAVVSFVLVWIGWAAGLLEQDVPTWTWVTTILLIDVAHVYATGFRVYFDRAEVARRKGLYLGTPILVWLVGISVYRAGDAIFWRVLAYLAVFHFVRQQYGWMMLYRRKANERSRMSYWLDTAAIYLCTIFPLVYWHAELPRNYAWFTPGDFISIPLWMSRFLEPVYWTVLIVYGCIAVSNYIQRRGNPGKDLVLITTAACWYVGIVAMNSDFAFTVTNVIIHGVPYMALVYWYWRKQQMNSSNNERRVADHTKNAAEGDSSTTQVLNWRPGFSWHALLWFIATIWLLAYIEELVWDRAVWHRNPGVFGRPLNWQSWHWLLVPLLAVPQVTHYILDGFIWRGRSNPRLSTLFSSPTGSTSSPT